MDMAARLYSNSSDEAQERLTELLDQGVNIAVINLKSLEFISSAGLRVLILIAKRHNKNDGRGLLDFVVTMSKFKTLLVLVALMQFSLFLIQNQRL